MPNVLIFGLAAGGICGTSWLVETLFQVRIALAVAPFEFAGAALGVLHILRTNAGYDRWWEARKLWGGIVNQSCNLVIDAMAYGPNDSEWREKIVRWAAVFPHVARLSLRGELPSPEVANLVGPEDARRVATAEHMPSFVAIILGDLLHEARETLKMDGSRSSK
jgi:ion channel-forming bestrophin family protein